MDETTAGCADQNAFSAWLPLDGAATLDAVPAAAGVLQVRRATGLVRYPRGKSAMVLYAPSDDMRAWLSRHRDAVRSAADAAGIDAALWVRTRTVAAPSDVFGDLLARFVARFGAAPVLQEAVPRG